MGGLSVLYSVNLRWTAVLLMVTCLGPVTTGGQRNNTGDDAPQNGTTDRMTTAGYNLTVCEGGYGYPEECPQPGDPITHTKCCRYYQIPRCCEPRARKVCAVKDKGLFVITAWDIDPGLEYDAIFCPQPDQSDQYVSCGYTGGDMTCYNRQVSLVLVWVTSIVIFGLFPIAFGIFTIISIRKERREEREMLAAGRFVKLEVEIEQRLVKKKEERAAAATAAEKVEDKAKRDTEKRNREMATANGREKSRATIEANGINESGEGIEANGKRKSSENIEVTSIEANVEQIVFKDDKTSSTV